MQANAAATTSAIRKTALYARIATTLGLALFAGVFVWLIYQSVFDGAAADAFLLEQVEVDSTVKRLSGWQRAGFFGLFLIYELPGIAALAAAWKLFSGYARGSIFTVGAAKRLRMVGWTVVLLAPVSILAESAAIALLKYLEASTNRVLNITLGEGEIYAIVFGLLIVVVGHIMYEAVRLNDENSAFI